MALVFDVALMEIHAGRDGIDLIHHVRRRGCVGLYLGIGRSESGYGARR
jgi:hypothetical protein